MQIRKHGITLSRLGEDDIELIRIMRNSDRIQRFMHYQEHITKEMQRKWYESIDNFDNFYFIIEKEGQKIGLIHGKKNEVIDDTVIVESGIFIWEEKEYQTSASIACSLIMADFAFYILNIEESRAKVLKSNKKMLSYNKKMGYEIYDEEKDVFHLKLTKDSYESCIKTIRHGLGLVTGDKEKLRMDEIFLSSEFKEKLKKELKTADKNQLEYLSKFICLINP